MQPNFIIRTNYFKVSRTVRHNVMAKETVSVPRERRVSQDRSDGEEGRSRARARASEEGEGGEGGEGTTSEDGGGEGGRREEKTSREGERCCARGERGRERT